MRLSNVAILACVAFAPGQVGDAAAAPPVRCTLAPVDGTASAVTSRSSDAGMELLARWEAVASCPGASAFDGRAVVLEQGARLAWGGGGAVTGTIELRVRAAKDLEDEWVWVFLTTHGTIGCTDGVCAVDLAASGARGRARVSAASAFTFTRAAGEVLSFKPADVEIATTGQ